MSGATSAVQSARLERRIAELEKRLAAVAPANRVTADANRSGGVPPKPTDATVVLSPGLAHISWTGSRSSDLRAYIVQVSTSPDFVGLQELETSETRLTFFNGIEGITYYARVFADNAARVRSDASNAVTFLISAATGSSAVSGQASITRFVKPSGSFVQLDTNNESETYGPCTAIITRATGVVKPFFTVEAERFWVAATTGSAVPNYLRIEVLRRPAGGTSDTVLKTLRHDAYADWWPPSQPSVEPSGKQLAFSMPYDNPGPGTWEYRLRLTSIMSSGGDLTWKSGYISIETLVIQ